MSWRIKMEFSIFSKYMIGYTVEQLGKKVQELGFSGIEFPLRPGYQCEPGDVSTKFVPMVKRLRDDFGIDVPIVTNGHDPSLPAIEAIYEACSSAGVRYFRSSYWGVNGLDYWEAHGKALKDIKGLEKLSEKYGVKTAIHMHAGKLLTAHCLGTQLLVRECDPKYVGVYLDPAHMSLGGEDYEMGLGIVKSHLCLVGVKNCCYVGSPGHWGTSWVPIFDGLVPWANVIKLLKNIGYDGVLCFHAEYSDHDRTSEYVADDLRNIKSLI
jgi:sugar phosphate isomerase/epimerase